MVARDCTTPPTADREKLKIGMDMDLVFVPLYTDEERNQVITFAFAPVES